MLDSLLSVLGIGGGVSKGTTTNRLGDIKWDDLFKILELQEQYNRPNRYGPFGGWEYDPETQTQRYVATDPGMQAAQERMSRRLAGEGFTPYQPPGQVSSITDALMANRMERMGLIDSEDAPWSLKQTEYGTRFGDRPGSGWQSAMVTPPPQGATPSAPVGGPPPSQPVGGGGGRPPMGRPPMQRPPYYYER